jgi:cytochrome c peroxidase
MKYLYNIFPILLIVLVAASCEDTPGGSGVPGDSLIEGPYDPTAYTLEYPEHFQDPIIPPDNPLTEEGIELGRHLFYDPILSSDSTMSCATCHQADKGFADGLATSVGVLGMNGRRSSMPIMNLAFNNKGFFWDGRSATLEAQALVPVEDHLELNESWGNVEEKLRNHDTYPAMFRAAFGIDAKSQITRDLAVKAIAQFERTLISANSRYDQVAYLQQGWPTDAEQRGETLFFFEQAENVDDHPGCSHCHTTEQFTTNRYFNNGLDAVESLDDFEDKGLGEVTNKIFENGKFRTPSLRNVALTAPYMHDGRFQTLEEVLDHYAEGGHGVSNEDANIQPFTLTEQDKQDIIAFLHMLTDTTFINNPAFHSPFE